MQGTSQVRTMNLPGLPDTAFMHPRGANHEAVDALLREVLTRLTRRAAGAAAAPPMPPVPDVAAMAGIPETGLDDATLVERLFTILAGCANFANPGYAGHMDAMPSVASVIGSLAAAVSNNNMLSAEMSPAFSRLEQALLREFATIFGLGKAASGVMLSGGSLANLQALAVARNAAFGVHESGLAGQPAAPVILASSVAHTSLQKSAMLLGLGTAGVIAVETDRNSRMRVEALERSLREVKGQGKRPFCVVATAGTTTTGNIDPLAAIARVCREHGLWLHVDAAYGGALAFSESRRRCLEGIGQADSITFNPQKWLYVARTCAIVLFADPSLLKTHFRIGAPYMQSGDEVDNIGEISVQGTRQAEVLKLWLSLQHIGRRAYGRIIDRACRLADALREGLCERPFIEISGEGDMNIVCFRGVPPWIPPDDQDAWNRGLHAHLLAEAGIFVSVPEYRGRIWLRCVLLNPYTDDEVVERLLNALDSYAALSRTGEP